MKGLEVSGAVRPLYGALGVKGLILDNEEALANYGSGAIIKKKTLTFDP
jgi:hypothetical protein